ncbi:MAG TPA: hypothetical protein VIN61_10270 [Gammaproteobacteria bacterium]
MTRFVFSLPPFEAPPALPRSWRLSALLAAALLIAAGPARAEPYLAVGAGVKCVQCHVNPTGGGKRNLFGMTYARTQLARRTVFAESDLPDWNSSVGKWLGVGGDYRAGYFDTNVPGRPDESRTEVFKSTVQVEVRAVPQLLTFYLDEQLAPGGSLARERYALVTPGGGKYTVKVGQFFLPFGWRLQDDNAFVRQRSGINMDTPDDGIELGLELPKWSAQIASTNGTAGTGSVPGKDQWSLSAVYVQPRWRLGASHNIIDDPLGDRTMTALFAGFNTGPITWLAELDFIEDDVPNFGSQETYATLFEGNWRLAKGHNLKVTYEFLDPSDRTSEDEQERYSVVWEHFPMQLLQARVGWRAYNGVPISPFTNRDEVFAELHFYF